MIKLRQLALILLLFAAALTASTAETNYVCIICGKGPLTGHIWLSQRGAICDDCYKLENRCSLCGLPIDKGFVKTGDGRFICKFDRPNAVLDATEAREIFADTRRELVELFGRGFTLNYPEVSVNLFDVDYWSEAGQSDGLHKFGFSSTRKTPSGECTHQVVILSGRLRQEIAATAAHEYMHLWINENRPTDHVIDRNTVEAICELAGYKQMAAHAQPEQQQRILDNPYTHGEIKTLVALEKAGGIAPILNWVKNRTAAKLTTESASLAVPVKKPMLTFTNAPAPLPTSLKLGGLLLDGKSRRAIINGVTFEPGETKPVKLRNRTAQVRCREIREDRVVLEVDGAAEPVILKIAP